eukprot:TRINITY_DN1494_c0_g2_i6.p1 TRINITY_DN1494_c0_g2~~TRINITY_DN1494_c0_g2_i6.p1  ORF type:complete len:274 (+),score=5.82 TRINITY_DN1494_c0_g2_i6:194-1015(+)
MHGIQATCISGQIMKFNVITSVALIVINKLYGQVDQKILFTTKGSLGLSTIECDLGQQAAGNCINADPKYLSTSFSVLTTNEQQSIDISPSQQYDCKQYEERAREQIEQQYCNLACEQFYSDVPYLELSFEYGWDNLCYDPQVVQNGYCEQSCGDCTLPIENYSFLTPQQICLAKVDINEKSLGQSSDRISVQSLAGSNVCNYEQVQRVGSGNPTERVFNCFADSDTITIPPRIGLFQSLENIDMCCNNFIGRIPPVLSQLTKLSRLNFDQKS